MSETSHPAPAARDAGPGVSAYAVFSPRARPRPRSRWRTQLPSIMFAGTLLLTAVAVATARRSLRGAEEARFQNAVQAASDRVRGRIETYVALLYGARGLFAASQNVTAEEFRLYVGRLEIDSAYPGIQGIGYSRLLAPPGAPHDPATLLGALRAGGSPAERLTPLHPRDEYHAIVYLEPTRRAAMDRARDRGEQIGRAHL